jgi:hypothetical protein
VHCIDSRLYPCAWCRDRWLENGSEVAKTDRWRGRSES